VYVTPGMRVVAATADVGMMSAVTAAVRRPRFNTPSHEITLSCA